MNFLPHQSHWCTNNKFEAPTRLSVAVIKQILKLILQAPDLELRAGREFTLKHLKLIQFILLKGGF
jgi:hypothetical protein